MLPPNPRLLTGRSVGFHRLSPRLCHLLSLPFCHPLPTTSTLLDRLLLLLPAPLDRLPILDNLALPRPTTLQLPLRALPLHRLLPREPLLTLPLPLRLGLLLGHSSLMLLPSNLLLGASRNIMLLALVSLRHLATIGLGLLLLGLDALLLPPRSLSLMGLGSSPLRLESALGSARLVLRTPFRPRPRHLCALRLLLFRVLVLVMLLLRLEAIVGRLLALAFALLRFGRGSGMMMSGEGLDVLVERLLLGLLAVELGL